MWFRKVKKRNQAAWKSIWFHTRWVNDRSNILDEVPNKVLEINKRDLDNIDSFLEKNMKNHREILWKVLKKKEIQVVYMQVNKEMHRGTETCALTCGGDAKVFLITNGLR